MEAQLFAFLNVVCDATGFQVVSCLGFARGPPASKAILRHFLTSWSSWAGLPGSIQVDRGKEFMAHFADYLKTFGVEQEAMPLEAPWKSGRVERLGGLWKEVFTKTVSDMQLAGIQDMIVATSIVTQVRNSFPRSSGYSPNQWVLGKPEVRLPGSLLIDDEAERLEVLEAAENPDSAMAKNLGIREAARVAQIRLDTDGRIRRALLHQSTPTRGPYPVGSYVYFYRAQTHPGSSRTYRWHGPARVIGVEVRNQRRLQDPDQPTDGGQPHSYWLRYGHSVVLVTGEQLRFASEDELLAAHAVPQEVLAPPYARGARGYVDLRAQPAQRPDAASTAITPRPAQPSRTSMIPGTSLPVALEHLPPVPEDEPGGLLDETQRTGATLRANIPQGPSSSGATSAPSAPATEGQRTGEPQPEENPVQPTTSMSTEPEPLPLAPALRPADVPAAQPAAAEVQPGPPAPAPANIFRDPDRLDGCNAVRRVRPTPEQPYMAEAILDDHWEVAPLTRVVREARLRRMVNGVEEYELDTADEEEELENFMCMTSAIEVFLTGKAVRSEIKLKDLSPEDRQKFAQAMEKEWSSWMKFNAVEILTPDQVLALPSDVKVIGTRWVHTDKNQKQRLLALHLRTKTGKSAEQVKAEFPFSAKSRLVVQGHQEDDAGIRTDSPTASLLAFNMVCAVAVIQGWAVTASDASTAYLQSEGISRLLVLRPPRPPPPGVGPNDLLRAKGSIYGTKDAGRSWWKKLYATLRKHSWRMSRLEPALFILAKGAQLLGVVVTHVDDLFSTGEGEIYEATLREMEVELHLTVKRGNFRFCGKNVRQENGEIFLDQMDAVEGIDYMIFPKDRRKCVNSPLTAAEITSFRGLIGQMGWVARQSRPDLLVDVSVAAQSMGAPKVSDVIALNKAVKVLKDVGHSLVLPKGRLCP